MFYEISSFQLMCMLSHIPIPFVDFLHPRSHPTAIESCCRKACGIIPLNFGEEKKSNPKGMHVQ